MNSREASRKSRNTIFRNMQQLFVTCNKIALICCKTGLNVGGKTRNTAFQPTTMHLVYPSPRPQILAWLWEKTRCIMVYVKMVNRVIWTSFQPQLF